ncbi:MAG: bifunctional proline dehydrogenase/L-glutamate gamma-semialdehyde dehydrogenase PutA, partial [Casimicrobiaceae bacterium]
LAAPDALFPQFASHNAFTIAAMHTLAGDADYEFQCLHGMGESVYDQIVGAGPLHRPCRIYAPVGSHETLLAYLVRRLLENGANSSFVNRIVDPSVAIADLVDDHVARARATGGTVHPRIPLPPDLFLDRRNSRGLNFADEAVLAMLTSAVRAPHSERAVQPLLASPAPAGTRETFTIRNPADHADVVGSMQAASARDVARAVAAALASPWPSTPAAARATLLERAADLLENARLDLMSLLVREAGKSLPNAMGEVREAVDFCRYYAAQARRELDGTTPRGPIVCIAPWNFPLAIFVGQVVAALAAGNPVLAKPAEQTPCIAAAAIELLHRAGIPASALQMLPGRGETVGAALVGDARIAGVLFTGSTAVAQGINRTLAQRDDEPLLIAETGGINAMIVDSSALPEQVVQDAITSAFDSAGQRCSALRLLCVQDDVADTILPMLRGAMAELAVGDPRDLANDIGPVIDAEARDVLGDHVARLRAAGAAIEQAALPPATASGTFFAPTLIELTDVAQLSREVFGPVLHIVRYREGALSALLEAINAPGYGLTHGIQTRIDETVDFIGARVRAGNVYVNRNIVGAVVGVQPFGGDGLSGTGPKAGGPHYLRRLVRETEVIAPDALNRATLLPGPTGEANTLTLHPRGRIACIATDALALALQVRTAHALGNTVLLAPSPMAESIARDTGARCEIVADPLASAPDAVMFDGPAAAVAVLRHRLAAQDGALVPLLLARDGAYETARLVCERTLAINTTAAGGNASLLSLTESTL